MTKLIIMTRRTFSKYKFIIAPILFLIVIYFLMTNPADNRRYKDEGLVRQIENDLFRSSIDPLNETFFKLKDSLDRVRDWKVHQLRTGGDNISSPFFGVQKIYECDSCNSFDQKKFKLEFENNYFIRLNGYTLKNDAWFFIDKGKYYIRHYPVWNTPKEIEVRYSAGYVNLPWDSALLIPISRKTYDIMKVLVIVLLVGVLLFSLYITIVLPVRILYSIATGKPFTKGNIQRLHIIGWVLLGFALLPSLISILIELVLSRKIPNEIYYPFIQSIFDNRAILIAGLIVLLLATAFKRGYQLQKEQDLTI